MKTIIQTELEVSELIELVKQEIKNSIEHLLNSNEDKDEFLSRREVLEILKISSPTLKRLSDKELIIPVRFGNSLRYSKHQVYKYLDHTNK